MAAGRNFLGLAFAAFCSLLLAIAPGTAHAAKGPGSESAPSLAYPVQLALDNAGGLWVTDYQNEAVLKLNPQTLEVEAGFRVDGRPSAIAVSRKNIYLALDNADGVAIFTKKGTAVGRLGGGTINDIALDEANDRLFLLEVRSKTVLAYDLNGNYISTLPSAGQPTLDNPTALAVDPVRHLLFVSDQPPPAGFISLFRRQNAAVRSYDYEGGSAGELVGPFSRPQGLTLDGNGRLYLVDSMRNQILVYDLETRTLIRTLGTFGNGPEELNLPLDVILNPQSLDIFATSSRAGRVAVFRQGGAE